MTGEEIREKAKALYAAIAHEVGRGGSAAQIKLIEDALLTTASSAYMESVTAADGEGDRLGREATGEYPTGEVMACRRVAHLIYELNPAQPSTTD